MHDSWLDRRVTAELNAHDGAATSRVGNTIAIQIKRADAARRAGKRIQFGEEIYARRFTVDLISCGINGQEQRASAIDNRGYDDTLRRPSDIATNRQINEPSIFLSGTNRVRNCVLRHCSNNQWRRCRESRDGEGLLRQIGSCSQISVSIKQSI